MPARFHNPVDTRFGWGSLEALDALRVSLLGKSGSITGQLKPMAGDLEDKPTLKLAANNG